MPHLHWYSNDNCWLDAVTVSGGQPTSLPTQILTTIESIAREQIETTVNVTDGEDALKQLLNLVVRRGCIGDYNHAGWAGAVTVFAVQRQHAIAVALRAGHLAFCDRLEAHARPALRTLEVSELNKGSILDNTLTDTNLRPERSWATVQSVDAIHMRDIEVALNAVDVSVKGFDLGGSLTLPVACIGNACHAACYLAHQRAMERYFRRLLQRQAIWHAGQ